MDQSLAEFLERMKKEREDLSIHSTDLGKREAQSDAMSLAYLDLSQLNRELIKEWAEKNQIDQLGLYKKCKALVAKKRGKRFQIKIDRDGNGQDLQGTYSISIIEPPDEDTYEKLTGMRQESYLHSWYHEFMDILDELENKVGFPK